MRRGEQRRSDTSKRVDEDDAVAPIQQVVAAIIVFQPDARLLERALSAIAQQVGRVLVIVNDGSELSCAVPPNAVVLRQSSNIGLGVAYNVAARWARESGGKWLLLLDQDSVAAPDMVEKLARALWADPQAAAAGPLWYDSRTGQDGFFVQLTRWGAHQVSLRGPIQDQGAVAVDFLISSGSLISLDAMEEIGSFDEYFFIEHVDTDWALRARAKHYRIYGVPSARLEHSLGERTQTLFFGRRAFLHSPARQYYLVRNAILLWWRPYAPWAWVLYDIRRTGLLMVYYLLFEAPRFERFKLMMRGMRDGLWTRPSHVRSR